MVLDAYGVCSPLTQIFQDIFENNPDVVDTGYGIIYRVHNNGNQTSPFSRLMKSSDGTFCNIVISFNQNYIENATDLSMARTTLHETFHAMLVYMLETGMITNSSPNPEYKDLLDSYIDYQIELNPNMNPPQHKIISLFVEDIATSLSIYGTNNGYTLPFSYYKKMAWGGLTHYKDENDVLIEYDFFSEAIPNEEDRNEILTILAVEATNTTVNGYNPEGQQPNSQEPCD